MVQWLDTTFPSWLMGLVIIGGGALLTWIAVRIRHGQPQAEKGLNELTEVFVLQVAAIYGILVAFTILIVWINIDRADKIASAQGGTITALARQSIALPQPVQHDLQQALRAYTESMMRDEWPALSHGQSNPQTVRLFNHIFVVAGRLPATTAARDIRTELSSLSEQRTALLLASGAALPSVFWVALLIGAVVAMGLSVFFYTETPRAHGLMAVAAAMLICASLWLIMEIDYPLSSDFGPRPDAFEQALTNITAIQSGQL
jgi:hypothetical protein